MKSLITLPGMIDIHAHLRDPGATESEDFYTGTCSALAGGVIKVFDMPNTTPPVYSLTALEDKKRIAQKNAVVDYGLYFGSDGTNTELFESVSDHVVGLKIYMNDSTGNLVVSDGSVLEQIFSSWPKTHLIIVHAEEEMIDKAITLSKKFGNKLHITHVTTKKALEAITKAKQEGLAISCDVTPHHLFLSTEDMTSMQNMATVHPRLEEQFDRDYLWKNLDKIDCIASDHAPHTIEEKIEGAAGFPGLETTLPLLLTAVKENKLSLQDVVRLTYEGPTRIFSLPRDLTTFVDVDLNDSYTIAAENQYTKCNWTPYEGRKVQGRIRSVVIRGTLAYMDGTILVSPGFGQNIKE